MEKFLELIYTFLRNAMAVLGDFAASAGLRLLGAAVILFVGFKVTKWVQGILLKSKGIQHLEPGVQTFLKSLIGIGLKLVVILTAISLLGVPMTNFVTILGSAGLAIGLSLQGSLSNLAGGLMILIFKPFKVGDYIEAPSGAGTVSEITILYTILTTPDNRRVVIPNGSISNEAVTNFSFHDTRRLDITISVAYDSDIEKVKALLLETASAHPLVMDDPAPFCRLTNHGESSLDFALRVWVKSGDYWTANFDLKESTKKALDENGIEIPYPQLDVHLDK